MKFVLALIPFIFTISVVAAPVVVSESVGQAGDRVITSREVQISAVLEKIIEPPKANAKNLNALYESRPGDKNFSSDVTALLLETVAHLEAESFDMSLVKEADLKASIEKVEKAVRGKSYWDNLEVSDAELKKMMERKILSKNFIKFKTDSMSSIITDQEAQGYYERNRANFGNLPFPSFRDSIKSFLARQQLQDRLRSWFEVIKRKYKVRNFLVEGNAK